MKIKCDLSISGLRDLQRQLENYEKDLTTKCELFAYKLAKLGIEVATSNSGNYGKYIIFSMRTEPEKDGCKVIFYAKDKQPIKAEWKTSDGIKTADVSPLLMAEFGSGFRAQNPLNVEGVGQGTFPNQTHAFDSGGWYWIDKEDKLHHSIGVYPSQPMFNASQIIRNNVMRVAKEVFGG